MTVDLSILIVNFNSFDLTRTCVEQFEKDEKLTSLRYEILIVDNGSIEIGENPIQSATTRWIYSKKNLGYGKANNLAFHESKGQYILVLNPDILAEGDTIVQCLNQFKNRERENFGLLGCRLIDPNGHLQESRTYKSSPIKEELYQNLLLQKLGFRIPAIASNTEIEAIMGSFLLFNRNLIPKIKYLFDDDFFMYSEEFELCHRIKKTGLKIDFFDDKSVVHLGGATVMDSVWSRRQKLLSQFLFIFKSKGVLPFLAVFLLKCINILTLVFTFPFIHKVNRTKAKTNISDFFNLFFQILTILLITFRLHSSFRVKSVLK